MTKQRKERLNPATYVEARRLDEILNSPDTPEAWRAAIGDAMLEVSNVTRVYLDHPALAKAAYFTMSRKLHERLSKDERERINDAFDYLTMVINTPLEGDAPQSHAEEVALRERVIALNTPEGEPQDSPEEMPHSNVVDMWCWAQSHTRPVRNLLFAERADLQAKPD